MNNVKRRFDNIHLQWFSDPAPIVPPEITFEDLEVEIVDPQTAEAARVAAEGDFATKSREDLIADMQTMKDQLAAGTVAAGPTTEELQAEVANLKQSMTGGITAEQMQAIGTLQNRPQQPQENDVDFKERIKSTFYDDPEKAMDELMARKLAPEVQRLSANNTYMSQKFLEQDVEKGPVYAKYKADIDREVAAMPPQERLYDPEVYQKAYQRVMVKNIDDIVAEKVAIAIDKANGKLAAPLPANTATFAETGINAAPNPGVKKKVTVELSPEEKQKAFAIGLSEKQAGINKARRQGLI